MRINYNAQAMLAQKTLGLNEKRLSTSTERLSSGYKINQAKDNPSGLAIARRMNAQIKGLDTASQNTDNGISVVQTAEGALAEMQEMIQRMSELSIKAATGSITDDDRKMVQEEIGQLKEEMERVASSTDFNGRKLLNGECDLKGYSSAKGAKIEYYSDKVMQGEYKLAITPAFDADGNLTNATTVNFGVPAAGDEFMRFNAGSTFKIEGNTLTIQDAQNEVRIAIDQSTFTASGTDISLDLSGIGAMRFQVGANEGQVISIRIPEVSLKNMGIDKLDLSTEQGAQEAIDQLTKANSYISDVRSRLGAYQNRFEHTGASLDVSSESVTTAYSRIIDVDMASEMTEYTKLQVLTQAGTSMLSQANQMPQQILQLLQ